MATITTLLDTPKSVTKPLLLYRHVGSNFLEQADSYIELAEFDMFMYLIL